MVDFGPTSSFNTERCETFNSLIRARNVYANRLAPSRDIARSFAVMEYMRFLCAGGTLDGTFRCGEDLITLFKTPAIQQFVNGIPARETLSQKHIYQPGTLRKVSTRPSYFCDTDVLVLGSPPQTINQLKRNSNFTLVAGPIQANIEIYSAGAVIGSSRRHQLINTGSYVKFSAAPGEVDYGFLSGCIQVPDGECTSLCIVQQLQPMDSFGFQLTNELECPLFQQTHLFPCIPSQCIRTSVSFCHECTSSCKFVRKSTIASIEREP